MNANYISQTEANWAARSLATAESELSGLKAELELGTALNADLAARVSKQAVQIEKLTIKLHVANTALTLADESYLRMSANLKAAVALNTELDAELSALEEELT